MAGGPAPSFFSGVYMCLCVLDVKSRALSKYYDIETGPRNSFYFLFDAGLELTQASLDRTVLLLKPPKELESYT